MYRRDEENEDRNMFDWRDKDKDIKINLSLEQFWSESLHFQKVGTKGKSL